jgi:segregation and condensation protein B
MKTNLKNKIEIVLFLEADPVDVDNLAKNLEIEKIDCEKELEKIQDDYQKNDSAFRLVFNKNEVQLVSRPDLASFIKKYFQKKTKKEHFSPAMLEVLSIVIYKGPIGKVGIEKIRGVNSDLILRRLTIKGLIEKEEQVENSKIFIYKPSLKLLKKLGVAKLKDLSEYDKLTNELKKLN